MIKILKEHGSIIQPYKFNIQIIEGFRYRVEDQLRAVTKKAIQNARIIEIRNEILNSEKLKVIKKLTKK